MGINCRLMGAPLLVGDVLVKHHFAKDRSTFYIWCYFCNSGYSGAVTRSEPYTRNTCSHEYTFAFFGIYVTIYKRI